MSSPTDPGSAEKAIGDNAPEPYEKEAHVFADASNRKPTIPPEGGTAGWLCILGGWLGMFCCFGFLSVAGVFQTIYEQGLLSAYDPSAISWIFTVQLCLIWLLGPLFGRVVDAYGPTPVLVPCSILCVFSLCMLSLSTEYYQIFLSQGLGFGIGAGGAFTTCFVVAGQWFVKRRGFAMGFLSSGSSLGGVVFPFFIDRVIADIGFAGAMRYTGLLAGILLVGVCLMVKARLPRKRWNHDLAWFDYRLFMDKGFLLYTIGAFLVMWGLWGPFGYLSTFGISAGFDQSFSIYLIAIINAASCPGRVIPGLVADKLGYFNVMTVVSVLTGLSVICLWIPFDYHTSLAGTIVFALVYGLASGSYVTLLMPCAAKSGSLETLGQRFGTFQCIIAIAALTGLPTMGAILNTQNGFFLGLQIFSAVSMVFGGLVIGAARMFIASSQKLSRV